MLVRIFSEGVIYVIHGIYVPHIHYVIRSAEVIAHMCLITYVMYIIHTNYGMFIESILYNLFL